MGNDFFSSAIFYLSVLAISYKDQAFEHEKEWRLFVTYPKNKSSELKKFEVYKGVLKPYFYINYPTVNAKKLIKLTVAPGNPNSVEWINLYLKSIESTCQEIVSSAIPFRNV